MFDFVKERKMIENVQGINSFYENQEKREHKRKEEKKEKREKISKYDNLPIGKSNHIFDVRV